MAFRYVRRFDLAINTAVRKLRQALDDSVDQPKFIQTLAKKGYRFIAKVDWIEDAPLLLDQKNVVDSRAAHHEPLAWRRAIVMLGRALLVLATAWLIWRYQPWQEPCLLPFRLHPFRQRRMALIFSRWTANSIQLGSRQRLASLRDLRAAR